MLTIVIIIMCLSKSESSQCNPKCTEETPCCCESEASRGVCVKSTDQICTSFHQLSSHLTCKKAHKGSQKVKSSKRDIMIQEIKLVTGDKATSTADKKTKKIKAEEEALKEGILEYLEQHASIKALATYNSDIDNIISKAKACLMVKESTPQDKIKYPEPIGFSRKRNVHWTKEDSDTKDSFFNGDDDLHSEIIMYDSKSKQGKMTPALIFHQPWTPCATCVRRLIARKVFDVVTYDNCAPLIINCREPSDDPSPSLIIPSVC